MTPSCKEMLWRISNNGSNIFLGIQSICRKKINYFCQIWKNFFLIYNLKNLYLIKIFKRRSCFYKPRGPSVNPSVQRDWITKNWLWNKINTKWSLQTSRHLFCKISFNLEFRIYIETCLQISYTFVCIIEAFAI